MKQAEDLKTLKLALDEPKRGRGRPAKVDALTPAERAKRYREAKRAGSNKATVKRDETKVTENAQLVTPEDYMRLKRMYWSLENRVTSAEAERDTAIKENARLEKELHNLNAVSRMNENWATEALNKLASLETPMAKAPKTNPLAAEVRKLKAELKKRDAEHADIVRAIRAEYDALASSQK